MKEKDFKPGDIIRSKSDVGRYVKVTDVTKDNIVFGIYMSKIGNISDETLILDEQYIAVKIYRLAVSADDLNRITHFATTVKHEATKNWENFIDQIEGEGVDLIMFYNKAKKVYCTFEGVRKVYCLVWNKQRTICRKTPCIAISLGNVVAIE